MKFNINSTDGETQCSKLETITEEELFFSQKSLKNQEFYTLISNADTTGHKN